MKTENCPFCGELLTRPWTNLDMRSCEICEVILTGGEVFRQTADKEISHYRYLQKIKWPELICPFCGNKAYTQAVARPPSLLIECCDKFTYLRIEEQA